MESDRRSMFLREMSCDEVNDNIFKHHNYNGLDSYEDLKKLVYHDMARRRMRKALPIWLGMTAFGGYNLTRMGVLSASGRVGALAGVVIGSTMTLTALKY